MVDLVLLRRTIEAAPQDGRAAMVDRNWLIEVEKDLLAGRAAMRELDVLRVCDQIRG